MVSTLGFVGKAATEFCLWDKAARDSMQMGECDSVSVKFCLQKQAASRIGPVGCSLPVLS